jgi:hypothetical protein
MFKYETIISPLDQFEIRNLFSIDTPLLGNINLSITNIGLYMTIATFLAFYFSILATNHAKIAPNKWSLTQETLYATIHSIVINQINNKKGQVYFPFMYALFIFILINNLIGMVKRSLHIYIIKTFSLTNLKNKIIRLYSSNTSNYPRYNLNNTYYLNPYYITGLVDAEGCFTTSIYKDSRMKTGWQVKPIFQLNLHKKDIKILEAVQKTWGVGKIYKHGQDSFMYRVSSLNNLRVITNHFDNYPLITQKLADYLLFKQSIDLIQKKLYLTEQGLLKLVGIKSVLNWGLSEKFKETFPNMIPVVRPKVNISEIKDVYWLIGFVEGEGSFMVIIQKSKNKKTTDNIGLKFVITQHSKDSVLFDNISNYLGCGRCYFNRNEVYLIVSTFSDINNKIISLFNKYPLLGTKKEDYLDFCKVAELIKSKDHLTKEGIENIKRIKSNMNSKRIHF